MGEKKQRAEIRLLLIRKFNTTFVGTGVLDCPQQKNFGRDVVFSADLCYNVVTRRAGACSRRHERLESKKAAGVNPRPTKGYGLCPKPAPFATLKYTGETGDKIKSK